MKIVADLQVELSQGDHPNFLVRWNDEPTVWVQLERESYDVVGGFIWRIVDHVYDASGGYELTDRITIEAYNVPPIRAVGSGGLTTLRIGFDMRMAPGAKVRAVVSKSSAVFATRWDPADIRGDADLEVDGSRLRVRFEGKNYGWHAPNFRVGAVVSFPNGHVQEFWGPDRGPIEPLAKVEAEEEWELPEPPHDAMVLTNWGTASRPYDVWDREPDRWYEGLAGVPLAVSGAAIVLGWVLVSTALRRGYAVPAPRLRWPARRIILALGAVAVIGAGTTAAVLLLLRGESENLGTPPFATERPLPALGRGAVEQYMDDLTAIPRVRELTGGNSWELDSAMYVTRAGSPVGVMAVLRAGTGVPLSGPWLLGRCGDLETPSLASGPEDKAAGLVVFRSLRDAESVYVLPLLDEPRARGFELPCPVELQ